MRKTLTGLGLAALFIGLVGLLSFVDRQDHPTKPKAETEKTRSFEEDYGIHSVDFPERLEFAGESFPMDDPQTQELFDRELLVNTYWQSQTVLFIKRAHRYFPVIEPILAKHGIPNDFKYLPLIESGFMPVVSPAGAVGFWQIMKGTGRDYGLEINDDVDERYHLEKATAVACQYLKEAYAEFGSWTLAAASYNMGMSGLKNQMERQRESDFFGLTLNPETARYLYRLLAVKSILSDPEAYGFHVPVEDRYPTVAVQTVKVDTTIQHVADFNKKYGITYRTLKYHNPWLRTEKLPNANGKVYEIKVPL